MLFITNRKLKQAPTKRLRSGRRIDFDLKINTPENNIYFCRKTGPDQYEEVTSKPFLRELRESPIEQILLYIHGFSNLPDQVFSRTEKLQKLFDQKKKNQVLVIPMIWPCDNDFGIVLDYWDDQKAADNSAFAFSRALQLFLKWRTGTDDEGKPCRKRINVVAHSMGNRVLRETLKMWNKYDLANGVPLLFRNTFMVAADIVNESLHRGHSGEFISHASRNVCVYYASDDLALRASKASNLKNKISSRRLGHSGPEDINRVSKNVYSVDCDDINMKYDPLTGHSYFAEAPDGKPGKLFEHMHASMMSGRIEKLSGIDLRQQMIA